jgi:nucleoid-associated protein YgaU
VPAVAPPAAAAPPPPPPQPEVAVTAVEADTNGDLYIAGTAKSGEPVRVYLDNALIGEAKPTDGGTWLVEAKKELPAGTYKVRADQVDGPGGGVIARAEVPFERDIDVAILKPVGAAGAGGGTSAGGTVASPETVIIKRGDNLWRIARTAWGKGIRWSTIYRANADDIRNPHWIYPGQVFVMPADDTAWRK